MNEILLYHIKAKKFQNVTRKVSFSNCLDWKNRIELSSQFSQRTGQQWPTEGGGGWEVRGATQPQSGEKRQGEATMLEREREREKERGESS